MSKLPPQLRHNAQKEREKEKEFGSPGQYSSHVGPTASSSSAKTDKTRSEKGKYGDSEYYDVLFEDENQNPERFLPSIRAQAPRAKGETYYQKKDGRKMSDRGRDRGRESGEEKGRPGRQRSNSAESRKIPVFDSESNRAALRVSTSPSPHQHHISKGTLMLRYALLCNAILMFCLIIRYFDHLMCFSFYAPYTTRPQPRTCTSPSLSLHHSLIFFPTPPSLSLHLSFIPYPAGDISESPLKGAQLKLFKLERKLAEQRQVRDRNEEGMI
jgi:hypothetical protein